MISLRKAAWMALHPKSAMLELRSVAKLARMVPTFTNEPWFDKHDVRIIDNLLRSDRAVVEYGSGSSTLYFAKRALEVHSVDSSKNYRDSVVQEASVRKLTNVSISVANLGAVVEWGWPIDHYPTKSNIKKWIGYLEAPWISVGEKPVGLVIVDGRFRSACAAYAIARILERGNDDAVIFLDDFAGREAHYSVLSEIAELIRTPGRGVIVKPTIVDSSIARACAARWIVDPR